MPVVVRAAYWIGSLVMRASSHRPAKSHFSEMNEFCLSTWMRPEESRRTRFEEDSSVAGVTASAGLVDRCGFVAVQGYRKLQAFRLLAQ